MLHLTPFFTTYFCVLAFVLGTVMASFLTCLGWRMCKGESVLKGRSHCDTCGHVLGARDLIPIISFLSSKGKCRYCGTSISSLNLYGELMMGGLFALVTYCSNDLWTLSLGLLFICMLYLISVTDIYEQIIPNSVLLVAIIIRVLYGMADFGFQFGSAELWMGLLWLLVDGLAVSAPLLILVLIMEKILKKEAMGGGDIKLIFVTGLYLGWARNILVLFFACIVGIVVGTIQQSLAKEQETDAKEEEEAKQPFYFAFGPSIAISAAFALVFGEQIIGWYLSLY